MVDAAEHPGADIDALQRQIEDGLVAELARLHMELGLSHHFLSGVSQLAIGADTLFAKACRRLEIPHRVFLPERSDAYFTAGSKQPDFSAVERSEAEALLDGPSVIQQVVVSDDPSRTRRFQQTNLQIVRASDLVVCLLREVTDGKPGGTADVLALAAKRELPALELRVHIEAETATLERRWHHKDKFVRPKLPRSIASRVHPAATTPATALKPPSFDDYVQSLREEASGLARWQRRLFGWSALTIIVTHLAATFAAAAAIAFHVREVLPWLLSVELVFLSVGFAVHQYLHASHASSTWAFARTASEVRRSVLAVRTLPEYLDYLFLLPYPATLRPLLRTLSVLHLKESRRLSAGAWEEKRAQYLTSRVDHQRAYYTKQGQAAARDVKVSFWAFVVCTLFAVLATSGKLAVVAYNWEGAEQFTPWLGILAVSLPVLAVGAISFVAALDGEARAHTFEEMCRFLTDQGRRIEHAEDEREFTDLVLEAETRLLGENANWFARRSFTGVS